MTSVRHTRPQTPPPGPPAKPGSQQPNLRLLPAPRPNLVEYLFRLFGDVLVPVEVVRVRYFRNLNGDTFAKALASGRIALPVTRLDPTLKGQQFIELYQLAVFIDIRSHVADEELARRLATTEPTTQKE
ncbi:pyocin activator PrtN family protein [Pseudomonas nitroreducens]|uniref:pyocin activator PrtN family protein n=1 Tax=Pseudomonas nitroreducens TaxID=46680 RepID=UPI00036DA0BC|nr:pyocin activator PrtN family protein [Pseudomonas nitroreducens]